MRNNNNIDWGRSRLCVKRRLVATRQLLLHDCFQKVVFTVLS